MMKSRLTEYQIIELKIKKADLINKMALCIKKIRLIIAGFFQEEQVGMELADQVVDMAYQALKTIPSKENLLYLSVAYARKGDYKKAFELMAGEPFFPSPVLSNALYKYLNLPVFHRDYIK